MTIVQYSLPRSVGGGKCNLLVRNNQRPHIQTYGHFAYFSRPMQECETGECTGQERSERAAADQQEKKRTVKRESHMTRR
jgi:hypothetical protein